MGVPLGVPNDPDFQKRVLLALLKLFEAPEGPLLVDYPEDAPTVSDELIPAMSCPVFFDRPGEGKKATDPMHEAFLEEIKSLRPWYDMGMAKRKRTTVGISGIGLDGLGDFLYAFTKSDLPDNPRQDVDLSTSLKLALEDLRAFYFEAATAQPGREKISNKALLNWFWKEAVAGQVLLKVVDMCQKKQDPMLNLMAERFLMPPDIKQHHDGR
jgi:hypothetical protein